MINLSLPNLLFAMAGATSIMLLRASYKMWRVQRAWKAYQKALNEYRRKP